MNNNTQAPSLLPFPADSADYEEYQRVMGEITDIQHDSAPDPEPDDNDYIDHMPDDSYLDKDTDDQYEGGEDSYLDSMYEDRYEMSEYGMDGCCGDF